MRCLIYVDNCVYYLAVLIYASFRGIEIFKKNSSPALLFAWEKWNYVRLLSFYSCSQSLRPVTPSEKRGFINFPLFSFYLLSDIGKWISHYRMSLRICNTIDTGWWLLNMLFVFLVFRECLNHQRTPLISMSWPTNFTVFIFYHFQFHFKLMLYYFIFYLFNLPFTRHVL